MYITERRFVKALTLNSFMIWSLVLLSSPTAKAVVISGTADTPVDLAEYMPEPIKGQLSSHNVVPDAAEQPFFEKLDKSQQITGSIFAPFSIKEAKVGTYVSWFGIIRKIESSPSSKSTTLTVENKFSDGITDTHIMTVSIRGSGDFIVKAQGDKLPLLPLRLVRVYGTIEKSEGGVPHLKADFIKEWDWLNFNFMDYGKDSGNPEWAKNNKIADTKNIYNAFPIPSYYKERLGEAKETIFASLNEAQASKFAKTITGTFDKIEYKMAAPKYVGKPVSLDNPPKAGNLPGVICFRNAEDFLEFKSGHAGADAVFKRNGICPLEKGTLAKIVGFKTFDAIMSAVYKIEVLSGANKGEMVWAPGFVLNVVAEK